MASAVHTVTSSATAALHSHGAGKAHGKAAAGDSFADMLAAADDATQADDAHQAATVAANKAAAAKRADDTAETDDKDAAQESAPDLLAAVTQTAAKPQDASMKDADKPDSDKASETDGPANDNEAAQQTALPQQPVMPPAAAPQTQAPVPAEAGNDNGIAPLAANDTAAPGANSQTQAPQPQDASSAGQEEASVEDSAAPQSTDKTAAKPQAAKAAKPADFKKALDSAKGPATAQGNDAAAANTKADAKQADMKQADARAADAQAPASPAAAQHNMAPQPDTLATNAAAPAAQNTAPAATPNTNAAQALPTPAFHHTPDVNGLAVEIAAKSQSGAKQFDIRLDPPELGRVEVRLSIDATGKASAHLSADQPQTLDLLRKDSTSLTQALRDAGLNVSQDGLNFSLRQQAGQDQQQNQGGRTFRAGFAATTTTEPANATASTGRHGLGLLDIKV